MNTFAAPDLDTIMTTVDTDIKDTNMVLGNTKHFLENLYKDLDASERVRQTVLTDSESEDETEEMRKASLSSLLRGTVQQRKNEIADSQQHLETAQDYKRLVSEAQKKRKRPLDDTARRDVFKRVAEHPYKPRSYGLDDDDDIPFFGQGDYGDNSTWTAFKSDWTPPKVHMLSGNGLIDNVKGLTGPPIKGEKYEGPSFLQSMNPFYRG